jgi:hypothetical protein
LPEAVWFEPRRHIRLVHLRMAAFFGLLRTAEYPLKRVLTARRGCRAISELRSFFFIPRE